MMKIYFFRTVVNWKFGIFKGTVLKCSHISVLQNVIVVYAHAQSSIYAKNITEACIICPLLFLYHYSYYTWITLVHSYNLIIVKHNYQNI